MPVHITVKYTDKPVDIPVRVKTVYGSVTKVKSTTPYKPSFLVDLSNDYDESDEWKEREAEEKELNSAK